MARDYTRITADFSVYSCPCDALSGVPMVQAGARFMWAEAAEAVTVGFIPPGTVLRYGVMLFLVYNQVLYELHDGIPEEQPTLVPRRNYSRLQQAAWRGRYTRRRNGILASEE